MHLGETCFQWDRKVCRSPRIGRCMTERMADCPIVILKKYVPIAIVSQDRRNRSVVEQNVSQGPRCRFRASDRGSASGGYRATMAESAPNQERI